MNEYCVKDRGLQPTFLLQVPGVELLQQLLNAAVLRCLSETMSHRQLFTDTENTKLAHTYSAGSALTLTLTRCPIAQAKAFCTTLLRSWIPFNRAAISLPTRTDMTK